MKRENKRKTIWKAIVTGLMLSLLFTVTQIRAADAMPAGWEEDLPILRMAKSNGLKIVYRQANQCFYVKDASGRRLKEAGLYLIMRQSAGGVTFPASVYYVRAGGVMPKYKGIVRVSNQVIAKRTYNGYYYYTKTGRLVNGSVGLINLALKANDGTVFKGYYYLDPYSRLAGEGSIRRIKKGSLDGIYYFGKDGKLDTAAGIHKLDTTLEDRKYKGYYCFSGANGSLTTRRGLVRIEGNIYFVSNIYGKVLTNAEKTIGGITYSFGTNGIGKVTYISPITELKNNLKSKIRSFDGRWSVYVKNLDSGESFLLNDTTFYAASLVKPFLLACLYDQENKGKLKLTSDEEEMCYYMITDSDNNFFNELVYLLGSGGFSKGTAILRKYLKAEGYSSTQIHHSLQPSYMSFVTDGGGDNATNAKDCAALLEKIYRGQCVNRKYSNKILKYMLQQGRTWKIPAGVPSGVRVANKTGETDSYDHDIAIVYGPKCTYILCVLSAYDDDSVDHVVEISRMVYNGLNR